MRRTFFAAAAALLLGSLVAPLSGEIIEQVLVKVNGDILTKTDLEQRQIAALRQRMNQDIDPDSLKSDEQLKKALADVTPRLLVEAVDELLLVQLGKERGYRLSDQQFRDWLSALRKEQKLEDDQKFFAALKQEGMTLDDLRKNVERQMLIQRVQQDEVGSKLSSITEEEARRYYAAHPNEFTEPASVTLREILIEVPTAKTAQGPGFNVGKDDDAAKEAAAVRARAMAGEDFASLASQVSTAPSKANGGLIGPIALTEISEALQKTLQAMKPGEITQPMRIQRGYQLLKLETLKPAAVQPFEGVRDLVAERVHADRQREEVRKFLTRIRSQAIIEWKNAELQKAYEEQVAQMASNAG